MRMLDKDDEIRDMDEELARMRVRLRKLRAEELRRLEARLAVATDPYDRQRLGGKIEQIRSYEEPPLPEWPGPWAEARLRELGQSRERNAA